VWAGRGAALTESLCSSCDAPRALRASAPFSLFPSRLRGAGAVPALCCGVVPSPPSAPVERRQRSYQLTPQFGTPSTD